MKNLSFRKLSKQVNIEPKIIKFNYDNTELKSFDRFVDKHPFVPSNEMKEKQDVRKYLISSLLH